MALEDDNDARLQGGTDKGRMGQKKKKRWHGRKGSHVLLATP